jgi:hypothetical protein
MAAPNTFSGGRAVFLVNSVPVAFAAGVSVEEAIQYEPVDVLNLLEVREFVPVAYTCSLSAQIFRVVGQSLKALGIMPRQEDIMTADDLECAVQDSVTGQTIALFQGVKCAGGSYDVSARGISQMAVNFVCIRVQDEFENPA